MAVTIDDALDAVLTALLAHREARRTDALRTEPDTSTFKFLSFADIPTSEEIDIKALAEDPVGRALRQSVRWIGKQLHRSGGIAAMHASLDRAAAKDQAHVNARISIMDHAWDGIGEGNDGWYA